MKKSTIWLLFVILISVIVVIWFNYTKIFFDISFSDIKDKADLPENAGRFGDVYGSLNTLFSGVAFAALFISILFQSAELSATREEMKNQGDQFKKQTEMLDKQSFENSLFQLMSFNNELIQSLTIENRRNQYDFKNNQTKTIIEVTTGRQVFLLFYNELNLKFEQMSNRPMNRDKLITPSDVYLDFFEGNEDKLGSYFQGLYQTLKLIDESSYDAVVKKKYVDLIIAQTSKYELYLLFYHGLSRWGDSGLKCLLERYEFFEFYPKEFYIYWRDMLGYDVSVFGWAEKYKFKSYLNSYCKVEEHWLGGRRIVAYIDGDAVPFDITDEVTCFTAKGEINNNILCGLKRNKIIWIEFAGPELVENTSLAGIPNQTYQEEFIFESPTKRYLVG
ncbi:putative phage abortive infection protein [Aeromonas sp. sif0611]|uniref:putative phage abortive infection protein n=1 Tax=Aeromonas sp. sif0611 TaxID=2854787 RepID=UPI001C475C11|nr:putative phage abortive infection protein [Aeromonas sp. sif0611]MBV7469124.1 putative phage abortive infection protein [Aeromonas sp. sif0611]